MKEKNNKNKSLSTVKHFSPEQTRNRKTQPNTQQQQRREQNYPI